MVFPITTKGNGKEDLTLVFVGLKGTALGRSIVGIQRIQGSPGGDRRCRLEGNEGDAANCRGGRALRDTGDRHYRKTRPGPTRSS